MRPTGSSLFRLLSTRKKHQAAEILKELVDIDEGTLTLNAREFFKQAKIDLGELPASFPYVTGKIGNRDHYDGPGDEVMVITLYQRLPV